MSESVIWPQLRAQRVPLLILGLVILLAVVGPMLSPWSYDSIDFDGRWSAPPELTGSHWFGTDDLGRDLFARCCYGGRISLLVGLAGTFVSLVVGVLWGAVAGYFGGRTDAVMMRIVDILYALPFLFVAVLLTVLFGRHFVLIFLAIGLINWLGMARIVRGQALALKRREFIDAAIVCGSGPWGIIVRHLLPNLASVVIVYATLTVPQVILVESFLSFLGLGIAEPQTSWGSLISDGALAMESTPWALVFPAALLTLTLLSLNFLGDGLRDRLNEERLR